jgi:hypothetical protein
LVVKPVSNVSNAERLRLWLQNEKLAQILRLKKEQGKKTVEDKRRANAHWKLRICDLLEIFIKKEPRSELLLMLPMPLLECIQLPAVFKVRGAHCPLPPTPGLAVDHRRKRRKNNH